MALAAGTVLSLSYGMNNAAGATEVDAAITSAAGGSGTLPLTITNGMLAAGALQPIVKTATFGIGYATGAGAAVTQITSRATAVTCSGLSGAITTDTSSLAAEVTATFTVTNTSVSIGDVVVVAIRSGSNGGNTKAVVTTVAAGSFAITIANDNAAGGTAETGAIIVNFAVIRAVSA